MRSRADQWLEKLRKYEFPNLAIFSYKNQVVGFVYINLSKNKKIILKSNNNCIHYGFMDWGVKPLYNTFFVLFSIKNPCAMPGFEPRNANRVNTSRKTESFCYHVHQRKIITQYKGYSLGFRLALGLQVEGSIPTVKFYIFFTLPFSPITYMMNSCSG